MQIDYDNPRERMWSEGKIKTDCVFLHNQLVDSAAKALIDVYRPYSIVQYCTVTLPSQLECCTVPFNVVTIGG